jgi:hypothetical protein
VSHRALASALLRQAVFEAAGIIDGEAARSGKQRGAKRTPQQLIREAQARVRIQAEAYAWLTTESASLEFWCRAAGIEMDTVIDGVHGAIRTVRKGARAPGGGRKRK